MLGPSRRVGEWSSEGHPLFFSSRTFVLDISRCDYMNLLFLMSGLASFLYPFFLFFFFCSFHFKLYYGQPLSAMITIKMVRFVLLVLLEGFSSSTLCVSFFLKAPVVPAPAQLEHLELILGLPGLSPTLVFEVCVLPRLKPISPPLKVSAGWY